MKYPAHGHELLQARKQGMKPRGVVLVTDSHYKTADCQLVVEPNQPYDFSMLRGLDVFIAMEADRIEAYKPWFEKVVAAVKRNAKELYVIPSYVYWG